jgi:hypothetical protein
MGSRSLVRQASGGVAAAFLAACLMAGLSAGFLGGTAGASAASSREAQAKKALLVRADFPKGWSTAKGDHGSTSSSGSSAFPGDTQLATCLGVPLSLVDGNAPSASSPEFNLNAKNISVDDTVSIFASAKEAQAMFGTLDNPKVVGCLSANMQGPGKSAFVASAGLPKDETVGTITVTKPAAGTLAPDAAAFTLTIPIISQGVSVPVMSTIALFIKGNAVQTLTFTSLEAAFPRSLSNHLTEVAVGRL